MEKGGIGDSDVYAPSNTPIEVLGMASRKIAVGWFENASRRIAVSVDSRMASDGDGGRSVAWVAQRAVEASTQHESRQRGWRQSVPAPKVKVYKTRTYLCCVVIGSIDGGIDADASKSHLEMSLVERWRSRLPHEGG